jgi:ribosomal protein S18 acetylase RimI-like enzyme
MQVAFGVELPPFDSGVVERLVALGAAVFGRSDPNYVVWRLTHMPDVSVFCASVDSRLVAFKAGYAVGERKYYSWLGGVHPDLRGQGIASALMDRQHRWLAERGYAVVETAVDQENTAMAQANLRHGFSVCGVRTEPQRVQILFSKALA